MVSKKRILSAIAEEKNRLRISKKGMSNIKADTVLKIIGKRALRSFDVNETRNRIERYL